MGPTPAEIIANAITMFGFGSNQHLNALKKYGPKSSKK